MKVKNKTLAWTGTEQNMTVYSLNVFKGRKLFDIRKCFRDASNKIAHTKKGISMSEQNFDNMLKILKNNEKNIQDWFTEKISYDEAAMQITNTTEKIRDESLKKTDYSKISRKLKSTFFYEVSSSPEGKELSVNENHPFFKLLDETSEGDKSLIFNLLVSLEQAISLYDDDQKVDAHVLLDDVRDTWSKVLSNYCKND